MLFATGVAHALFYTGVRADKLVDFIVHDARLAWRGEDAILMVTSISGFYTRSLGCGLTAMVGTMCM